MSTRRLGRKSLLTHVLAWSLLVSHFVGVTGADEPTPPLVYKVGTTQDRIEMTVNTSRILSMEHKVPRVQVNNPDILTVTPISARDIQIHAKKTGITQVNLWDEKGQIHALDVIVYGDVKELSNVLAQQFPDATIQVIPTASSVILKGFVSRPDSVSRIMRISEDYFPKVINNLNVGGAQQVLLYVKVLEISRTKLRDLGFDFADVVSDGSFVRSGVSGLLRGATSTTVATSGQETFAFGIIDSGNSFFGLLAALQRNNVAKLHAEPTLVTVSGRPAQFQSGGEIPVLIPQGLGNVSVDFRPFGTQVDFVPIVLGDGKVRLEVRPRVSEIDRSLSVVLNGSSIPGFRTRQVDTGVEMRFGQTLALAGLIQYRVESSSSGIPWVCDIPVLGLPFRRVNETMNEIELLVMVRPELAEALDPEEVPPCGPGDSTISPTDCQLYFKGSIEEPNPNCMGGACGPNCKGHGNMRNNNPGMPVEPASQNGVIIEDVPAPKPSPASGAARSSKGAPSVAAKQPAVSVSSPSAAVARGAAQSTNTKSSRTSSASRVQPSAAPYNRPATNVRQSESATAGQSGEPGLIGPTGYDVIN